MCKTPDKRKNHQDMPGQVSDARTSIETVDKGREQTLRTDAQITSTATQTRTPVAERCMRQKQRGACDRTRAGEHNQKRARSTPCRGLAKAAVRKGAASTSTAKI